MKKILNLLLVVFLLICSTMLTSCVEPNKSYQMKALYDVDFGHVYTECSIEEFNAYGFEYGDSINIVFSNGKKLMDIPYYNGYYGAYETIAAVGYKKNPHVCIANCQADSLYAKLELQEGDTMTITLNEKGKYKDIQDALSMSYEDERQYFDTDIEFTNSRYVIGGNLKEDLIVRSCSPCDNTRGRALYMDALLTDYEITYVLNLAENETEYQAFAAVVDCQNYKALHDAGKVDLLDLNSNYLGAAFQGFSATLVFTTKVSNALYNMTKEQGHILIHCQEGKDRTGFVCMLILALCHASIEEMINDYMITYDNYYHINAESNPTKYNAIKEVKARDSLSMLGGVKFGSPLDNIDFYQAARDYLTRGGLNDSQIDEIENYLSK